MKKLKAFILICIIIISFLVLWYRVATKTQSATVFLKEKEYTIDLFYPSSIKDPNKEACQYVYPFQRTIKASRANLVLKAMQEMISGPSESEKKSGAYNALPKDSNLVYFNVDESGVEVYVDYDLRKVDACAKKSIDEQIRQTLLQFSHINEIEINSLDFVTEEE